ncbi:MAG TPA: hypothetical protein VK348_06105, partial [Planctomycetota bacterium]|nr:hypothetical protein [Planctomycetota bacterium]
MRILVRAVTGFAVLGAGCTDAGLRRQAETPGFIELRNSIGDVAELDPTTWPSSQRAWAALGDRAAVLVLHDGWRVPDGVLEAETKAGLRQFLARGGRLVLLGYAARLVHELGVEPRPPDVCAPYRWGYDDRTTLGKCQLGFKLVSGRQEDLVVGLTHAAQREHVYLFTGGTGVCVPTCLWEGYDPERGEVLGRLSRLRDNQPEDLGAVALAQWRVGAGSILACGLLPDLQAEDPQLRQNAAAFTTALARWLVSDREKKQVRVWRLPEPPVPPPPEPLLPLGQRELPAAPLLAHWGVEVPLARSDKSPPPSLDAVVHDVLLPSWLAGADLLRLDLADPAQGWPLSWPGTDPLRPPEEYRGSAFWPQWGRDACGLLCVEAHARGVLVQGGLEPLPVPSAGTAERLAGLRFVARELADTRLLGERAFDGFVLRPVNADPGGYTAAMLQDFTPGGALVQLGALVPAMPGSTGAVDADDGRMRGLSSAGLSAAFRGDGFPGDLFPFGRLDCTAVQALASSSEQPVAGGSSGDWIVTQANDFVRTRMGRGASMWWRAHDPATLATDTLDYVRGISLEPLRAAV